jgi:hypothetical protein
MEPWERSELGGVGEGFGALQPLTPLRLASRLASLRNPLPKERERPNKLLSYNLYGALYSSPFAMKENDDGRSG